MSCLSFYRPDSCTIISHLRTQRILLAQHNIKSLNSVKYCVHIDIRNNQSVLINYFPWHFARRPLLDHLLLQQILPVCNIATRAVHLANISILLTSMSFYYFFRNLVSSTHCPRFIRKSRKFIRKSQNDEGIYLPGRFKVVSKVIPLKCSTSQQIPYPGWLFIIDPLNRQSSTSTSSSTSGPMNSAN